MLDTIDHGHIREIRLARPPANALNQPLFDALNAALREAAESASAVVVSGLPGMFSAGLDVPELLQLERQAFFSVLLSFLNTTKTIATMPVRSQWMPPRSSSISGKQSANYITAADSFRSRRRAAGRGCLPPLDA